MRSPVKAGNRVPVSTYRVQLHAHFTFADLRHIASYLAALGATECYCSPPFTARAGSVYRLGRLRLRVLWPRDSGTPGRTRTTTP